MTMMERYGSVKGGSPASAGGEQCYDLMVQVYCHSYPHAVARVEVLDAQSLRLHCDMSRIPAHAFLEVEFELFVDSEIKSFRFPVYKLTESGGSVVRFSFEPTVAVLELLERFSQDTLKSATH